MTQHQKQANAQEIAAEIDAQIRALPLQNTPGVRAVRRQYSRRFKQADPAFILDLARELLQNYDHRWVAYELINHHQAAFQSLSETELEAFGQGINSWWTVDAFARGLAGPAWLNG